MQRMFCPISKLWHGKAKVIVVQNGLAIITPAKKKGWCICTCYDASKVAETLKFLQR
jgi:hypothetical protein